MTAMVSPSPVAPLLDAHTEMLPPTRRFVGVGNALAGAVGLVALVAAYGLAERLVVAQDAAGSGTVATETISWWGPDVTVSLATALLLVGAAAGFVGSVVQQSIVFASRAGKQTLETCYVWWYVLRPVWSALLGSVVVLAVSAGLVSIGDETTSAAGVTVLVTAAAVAGLSTDTAMQRLQSFLGAGDPSKPGSQQG